MCSSDLGEVVKFVPHGERFVFAGRAVFARLLALHGAGLVREEKFPRAAAHGLERIGVVVEKVGVVRILRAGFAGEERPDVEPVDLVRARA